MFQYHMLNGPMMEDRATDPHIQPYEGEKMTTVITEIECSDQR